MMFDKIIGKTLKTAELTGNKDIFTLTFSDGTKQAYGVEGDCCSSSWIEHLTAPDDLDGAILLSVEDGGDVAWDGHVCSEEVNYHRACGHDSLQVYNQVFRTNRGNITLEYRNDSNGYYGGYMVEL